MDSKQWHEYVDVIYYINLDIREDRKEEFLEEMRRMGVPLNKIVRFRQYINQLEKEFGAPV